VLITLQELQLRPVPFKVEIPKGEIEFDDQVKQVTPLHAEGVAKLLGHSLGEIEIRGSLRVTVEAPCDRCLETATVPVEKEFDLLYCPADEVKGGGEDEIEGDATEVAFYEGDRLNLNDVLREVVLLALPMQLVCSEECKGICPGCGQNRNLQQCNCQAETSDDRWNKLKALRGELASRH
jgi:uncharacterized protein